jgi:hypothetical protein
LHPAGGALLTGDPFTTSSNLKYADLDQLLELLCAGERKKFATMRGQVQCL